MSVKPQKAEVAIHGADVRYVPLPEVAMPVVGAVRTIQSIGGPDQLALGLWDRYDALHA